MKKHDLLENRMAGRIVSLLFFPTMAFFVIAMSLFLASCGTTGNENTTMKIAIFKTNLGDIEIELFTGQMPVTTKNFISLAERGFYDGTRFHRVISNFMIQGGDPLSKDDSKQSIWGSGGPGYEIKDEFVEGLSNIRGTISMANHGPNTGGSQFFINVVDNTFLDFNKPPLSSQHPVFGRVIKGMDVVDHISQVAVDEQDRPLEVAVLEKIIIQ